MIYSMYFFFRNHDLNLEIKNKFLLVEFKREKNVSYILPKAHFLNCRLPQVSSFFILYIHFPWGSHLLPWIQVPSTHQLLRSKFSYPTQLYIMLKDNFQNMGKLRLSCRYKKESILYKIFSHEGTRTGRLYR